MNYKTTEQIVINFIRSKNLIEPGDKILLGLSGGADSVFLLNFLHKFRDLFKIEIAAAHINHSLRGKEANVDQKFSEMLCEKLNIPFFTKRVYVKSFAKKNSLSIEEAARNLRYLSLDKIAKKIGAGKIATAHNIDDNAETVLFNLSRGTGISGMAGIPYRRENIIRPILILEKSEIVEYLKKRKIKFQTDSTNFDNSFSRNFLRNEIIPLIRKNINPAFSQSVFKFSEIFKNFSKMKTYFLQNIEEKSTHFENGVLNIEISFLQQYNGVFSGEIFKNLFAKYFSVEYNFNDFVKLNDLIKNQTGTQIIFKDKLMAVRERNSISFYLLKKEIENSELLLAIGEAAETKFGTLRITRIKNQTEGYISNKNKFSEIISADNLEDIFILRRWKNGDKFIPLGMKNFKKISDFLTEQRVSAGQKREQLVLTNGNKIVWVIGLRIDNRFKISSNTKKIIRLWIK